MLFYSYYLLSFSIFSSIASKTNLFILYPRSSSFFELTILLIDLNKSLGIRNGIGTLSSFFFPYNPSSFMISLYLDIMISYYKKIIKGIGSFPTKEFRAGVQIQCWLDSQITHTDKKHYHISDSVYHFNNIFLTLMDYYLLFLDYILFLIFLLF